jgi:hypothetical protein
MSDDPIPPKPPGWKEGDPENKNNEPQEKPEHSPEKPEKGDGDTA